MTTPDIFAEPLVLRTERLVLRQITESDGEGLFAILGYDLAREYWRRGLMSEAVAAVLRLGFEQMGLHRVEATVMAGNTASAALLGRAGFRREGVMRERALKQGEFRDVWMFGLIRTDWGP
jgi:[ribosomal protein S5]-alanine N-acetyltransferase